MENRDILVTYIAIYTVCLISMFFWGRQHKISKTTITLTFAVPTLVAVIMSYIFLIEKGATIVQFAAHSDWGIDLWRLWFDIWPMLLLLTTGSGASCFILLVINIIKNGPLSILVPVYLVGMMLSAFAFIAVGWNFPSA